MKTYKLTVEGQPYKVDVESFDGKRARVRVNDKAFEVQVEGMDRPVAARRPRPQAPRTAQQPLASPSGPTVTQTATPAGGRVLSPMPGLVLEVLVSTGATVTAGTPVVRIEAMKMENEIPAPSNGTVKEILVKATDRVATDDVLLVIDPA